MGDSNPAVQRIAQRAVNDWIPLEAAYRAWKRSGNAEEYRRNLQRLWDAIP